MGFLTKPSVNQINPNTPQVQGLQSEIASFLQGQFGGGASPFAGMTSDLQRGATNSLMQFMNANPEQQTFDQLSGGLMDIFGGGSAANIGEAALPVFQTQLQRSLGGAANAAPGRFSTTFESQGVDLANRAAQDFALLQAQAMQQEMQNRLGAAGLLGTLAGQAGNAGFGRALQAGQLGLAQTQQMIDPQLQLLLGGLGFARPAPMDTVVGKSPLDYITDIGGAAVMFPSLFGGGDKGGKGK